MGIVAWTNEGTPLISFPILPLFSAANTENAMDVHIGLGLHYQIRWWYDCAGSSDIYNNTSAVVYLNYNIESYFDE